MKCIETDFLTYSAISKPELEKYFDRLLPEIESIQHALTKRYATKYAMLSLPGDQELKNRVKQAAEKMLQKKPTLFILIGIGGSHLGAAALIEAIKSNYYNASDPSIAFYALDTLDVIALNFLLQRAESQLKQQKNIIVTIVTKSGGTSETLINASFFIDLLKKYAPDDYQESIMIITDDGSQFAQIAQKNTIALLTIPPLVPGRYSVFSAAGLFVAACLGLDIDAFLQGAADSLESLASRSFNAHAAAQSAVVLYAHLQKGMQICDTFIFSPQLFMLGQWYRQLVAESLGKDGTGILPLVSIGTTDLHSQVQFYLDGPPILFTTFVTVHEHLDTTIPQAPLISTSFAGKKVSTVMNAVIESVKEAYQEQQRPFATVHFKERSEYAMGEYMIFKMLEVIYLAALLKVNAFDQPAVELYKKHMRKLLA